VGARRAKSTRVLSAELKRLGIRPAPISSGVSSMGYSLQANAKVTEGDQHPDQNSSTATATSDRHGFRLDERVEDHQQIRIKIDRRTGGRA